MGRCAVRQASDGIIAAPDGIEATPDGIKAAPETTNEVASTPETLPAPASSTSTARPGSAGLQGLDRALLPQLVQQLTLNLQIASTSEQQRNAGAALQAALQAAAALDVTHVPVAAKQEQSEGKASLPASEGEGAWRIWSAVSILLSAKPCCPYHVQQSLQHANARQGAGVIVGCDCISGMQCRAVHSSRTCSDSCVHVLTRTAVMLHRSGTSARIAACLPALVIVALPPCAARAQCTAQPLLPWARWSTHSGQSALWPRHASSTLAGDDAVSLSDTLM